MSGAARLGTVAVLLAMGLGAGQLTADPERRAPAAQEVPLASSTAVCPDVRPEGDRGSTAVTAAGAASRAAGPLQGPLRPGAAPARGDAGPFLVTARGGGLVVEQTTRATAGSRRGTSSLTCPSPTTSAWFIGGATTVGAAAELVLVNAGDVAALVDVRVWTGAGPADPGPGRAVPVPARSRSVVPLDRLAPDRDLLALHVRATRGQVAPALRVVRSDGRTPLGTDWVPPTLPPALESVVPGLPAAGTGRRTALLTNPGEDDARVALALVTGDGEVPLDPVAVPRGTSVAVDLSGQLTRTPGALRVRADVPVLAGALVVDRQGGPVREIAFSAAAPAVAGEALLADVRLAAATEVLLLLTAADADAVVEVVALTAPGDLPPPLRVEVPASTTVATRLSRLLPAGTPGSLTLELRVRGRVHAARYSVERAARGPLTTLLPVLPQALTVRRPAVVADPGAGR